MPELPRGTVTFLFTDIEGSTTRWERDRPAMAEAVEQHLALLRVATERHGGVLFKIVGDAVQAAFPTAAAAIAAALDAQRTLLAAEWGAIGPLRVRMALHAGEAEPRNGDYLASSLNRLARLLQAGHGGQILLSQTVQQLARGSLPAGVSLQDLGEYRLRDLLDPERVFQLRHADVPTTFPLLRTLDARPNNLPRQPTALVGRAHEVATITALLRQADVQLVTLTGPGGTGKTRLGLQAGAEHLDDFVDGVFFVPLASLADPDLVPTAIAQGLGLREQTGLPMRDQVREAIAAKAMLLVLDNVEHLIAAASDVGELLASCPGLKVLATSRVPLRLRAEREYPVPPLGLPHRNAPPRPEQLLQSEAVRLFLERAQAILPAFSIDTDNAPAIIEICHRLDGLPLAIELAAARIKLLPPAAIAARLDQRLKVLTSGARDLPPRQRTLRDAIAWSHDLLSEEEQLLFRRLSVFAGGATFAAVEAVGNPTGERDAFTGVASLVDNNLVRQEERNGEPRFGMLETIREFGLEQLQINREEIETRQRHARYFLALAEEAAPRLDGRDQGVWLDRLETEHDNLRAALTWLREREDTEHGLRLAASLMRFWDTRDYMTEGRAHLIAMLQLPGGNLPTIARARALAAASELATWEGEHRDALHLAEEALEIYRTHGDDPGTVSTSFLIGMNVLSLREPDRAQTVADNALVLARRVGDRNGEALILALLGQVLDYCGDHVAAAMHLQEAVTLFRQVGNLADECAYLGELAVTTFALGDRVGATSLWADVLRLARDVGEDWMVARYLEGQAELAVTGGQPIVGTRLLGAATAWRDAHHAPVLAANQFIPRTRDAARVALGEGRFAEAFALGRTLTLDEAVVEAERSITGAVSAV